MPTLLPSKQVFRLAPELGLCVAMGTSEGDIVGHLFGGEGSNPPPADLQTRLLDEDFVYCLALTTNGRAFLDLLGDR
jgi:hypothetical protein